MPFSTRYIRVFVYVKINEEKAAEEDEVKTSWTEWKESTLSDAIGLFRSWCRGLASIFYRDISPIDISNSLLVSASYFRRIIVGIYRLENRLLSSRIIP